MFASKTYSYIILGGERLNYFLRAGTRQRYLLIPVLLCCTGCFGKYSKAGKNVKRDKPDLIHRWHNLLNRKSPGFYQYNN